MPGYFKLLIIALVSTLQACVLGFNPEDTTSSHHIHLHANPRVGDYVIRSFPMPAGEQKVKWEVLKVDEHGVQVKRSWLGEDLSDVINEFILAPNGEVRQATLIYQGKAYPQRIVRPPQTGSLENLTRSKNIPANPLQTGAGEFPVSSVQGYTVRVSLGIGTVTSASVEYLSDQVPFKILEVRSSFDLEADPFIDFLTRATYTLESINNKSLRGMFQVGQQTADAEGVQYERLLEYHFAR